MAENNRRTLGDILFGRASVQDERKRFNFFNDNDSMYNNVSFIQGWQTRAGSWEVEQMGNGASNSAVVSCLQVLGLSFSEATLKVKQLDNDGLEQEITNHPLTKLMRRPNPFMSGDIVQQYIINAMHVSGDAYLIKQKNQAGQLVALYPLMPESVVPKGNDDTLITHYEYETNETNVIVMPKDMVHIRLGLNQQNHKKGFAPLRTVLREIYGDESAGQMATALLANSGVPNVLITPKDDYGVTQDEAEQIAKAYKQKVGGRNKGMPLVMSGAMDVKKMAFSPTELDIGTLRRVPEERISAVLGVPAILAGLGAGLERATYSNAKELREFFTENKLIPLWKQVGEELTQQILLKDYDIETENFAEYDFANVRALQTDQDDLFNRLNVGVQGGWITVAEAREQAGLPTDDKQSVYLMDANKIIVPANDLGDASVSEVEPSKPKPSVQSEEPNVETEDDEAKGFEFKVVREIDGEFCVIAEESGKNMGCYPTRELAEARLEQISRYSDGSKIALEKDKFSTKEEAEKRAEQIGCVGFHTMDDDGNTIYMPCDTHDEYEEIIGNEETYGEG
ncbi:MAG: putative portal protein [Prokaryotic dsDNA virus sp.]|nr:MAG: putative portal protein [Prokaryotic dsDNA virus sp.]|tara:strand:+ start:18527 stop:20227 length:1701 start_codon:yes stop_codon:yes gene_type:complete